MKNEAIKKTLAELYPGRVLPNGATVIAAKPKFSDLVRVLCVREHLHDPYVVWSVGVHKPLATFWGHYFSDYKEAMAELSGDLSSKSNTRMPI